MNSNKLGLLLSTPPDNPNLKTVVKLSRTALGSGYGVYLYLIDEGTRNLNNADLQELKAQGLKLFVCAYGAQRQGIEPNDQALFCGLVVLSDLVKACNRFLSFN